MSKKRQRERHDVSVQLVEIYEDLANENEEIRLKAAAQLLARENLSREDVLATFRRLVRGLCSSRKAARLGFSIALTEFITQYAQSPLPASKSLSVSQEDLVRLLQENTQTSEKVSGQVSSLQLNVGTTLTSLRKRETTSLEGFSLQKRLSNLRLSLALKMLLSGIEY